MAWNDFETLFKAACKATNESYLRLANDTGDVIEVIDALGNGLDVLDTEGKTAVQAAIRNKRNAARQMVSQWPLIMDRALAYGGTQLTTPSSNVRGTRVLNREELLREIRDDMVANARTIKERAVTYAAEPSADDNGIIDRLPVDENGSKIEAGLHNQAVDARVDSKPTQWQSIIEIKARNQGADIFNLLGPAGRVLIGAHNDAFQGQGIVTNPNLTGANSATHGDAVTSLLGWALGGSGVTHTIDTSIKFRGLAYSHKLVGTGGATRTFTQPLIVRSAHRRLPRNHKWAIFKTGSPTGNITLRWGSMTQVVTMASLSAGWNYFRADRDKDLFPKNFDTPGATLAVEFECTTGDASNYVNLGFFGGQIYTRFDGAYYGHWSRTGLSTLYAAKSFADSMTAGGKNASALYLAYHNTPHRELAYLPSVGGGGETLADYS